MSKHAGFHNKEHYSPECSECKQSVVVGKWAGDNEICLSCESSRTAIRKMIAEGGRGNLTIVNHILENCPACKKAIRSNNES